MSDDRVPAPIAVETMRTLLVCRGPIAFETLEIYRRCGWQLPHVVIAAREWIAEQQRTAPWIVDVPPAQVHYIPEYTDVEAVLQIAAAQRLEAIYPGYGFLAENAAFAARVEAAGMRFIGPTPATLRTVGDKDAAIQLAKTLGIPTIPGDDALVALALTQSQEAITAATVQRMLAMAQRYPGYPLRLKHPAGGGGKGQRVLTAADLQAADAAARIVEALVRLWAEMGVSEAAADARKGVLIELNLPRPLHWEVQLFGDGETVVHFAARDCSLQNHGYQKFIELALHPAALAQEIRGLSGQTAARLASLRQRQATLERVCADALRLGQAVHLRGAATVEFLIDEQWQPYFLEVNPRIQVEHGVTEGIARVHGAPISLVEWQQRVAAGERLPFRQSDITWVGDAVEVRLNAWHEDLSPVLGGVIEALRFTPPPDLKEQARLDAGGLLQREQPWIVPSYDANFALLIVMGQDRYETLDRLLTILDHALHIQGNVALQTNLQPLVGLLTFMRALPPATAFRTDTSLLWTGLTALVEAQKQPALSLLPGVPRQAKPYDAASVARLLRATLEASFAHPSRLLAYYLPRLRQPQARPLAPLEVLWQLATACKVPQFAEEQALGVALQQAADALWDALSGSAVRLTALLRAARTPQGLEQQAEFGALCAQLATVTGDLTPAQAAGWLRDLCGWLSVEVPAITALVNILESTQLHMLLEVHDDLSITRPAYLQDDLTLARLQQVLRQHLRPTMLRHGELLAPMEATIYHQPEPGAPMFVQVGEEVKVGQTLALLEAMKMFTELPSPVDGVVLAILVDNGQGVKTGTPLFRIATREAAEHAADDLLPQILERGFGNRFRLLMLEGDEGQP